MGERFISAHFLHSGLPPVRDLRWCERMSAPSGQSSWSWYTFLCSAGCSSKSVWYGGTFAIFVTPRSQSTALRTRLLAAMRRAFSYRDSVSPVQQINFHFEAVRVKPPVSHAAAALVPTFCGLYGAFGAPCATDHDALLEILVWMTVDPEQNLEKDHSYRHMAIAPYDPTVANGSAEAARADQRAHRASPTHHVGWETPTHDIHCCRTHLAPDRHQPELWQSASNPRSKRSFPC